MKKNCTPRLTLVLGGAASGKSAHAEALVTALARPRIYIATAQAYDAEMTAKIADHQRARGPDWTTHEVPEALPGALAKMPGDSAVLIDCLTLWLSNRLLAEADLEADRAALVTALKACPAPVVVVSNEAGLGVVPDNALARRFRNAQGALNQAVAAAADRVVLVTAGLPQVLK